MPSEIEVFEGFPADEEFPLHGETTISRSYLEQMTEVQPLMHFWNAHDFIRMLEQMIQLRTGQPTAVFIEVFDDLAVWNQDIRIRWMPKTPDISL